MGENSTDGSIVLDDIEENDFIVVDLIFIKARHLLRLWIFLEGLLIFTMLIVKVSRDTTEFRS